MTITKNHVDGILTMTFEGWLDTQSSPQLAEEIENLEELKGLIFDFDKLEYISSSGLRQVTATYKKAKAENFDFKIINVESEVMSVFSLTGLDKKFDITGK